VRNEKNRNDDENRSNSRCRAWSISKYHFCPLFEKGYGIIEFLSDEHHLPKEIMPE